MLNEHTARGKNSEKYVAGTISFGEGEGLEELDDYLSSHYSGFYGSDYDGYRGNHSTSAALNHLLESELDSSKSIGEFDEVEVESGAGSHRTTMLDIALSPDALEALRASLDASPYDSTARYRSTLDEHFRRVVQSYAVELTDYERPTADD